MIQKRTIGIVGTGHVGIAAAYAVFMAGMVSEIILVDKDYRRAEGEAMDLMHGQAFAGRVTVQRRMKLSTARDTPAPPSA